MGTITPNPGSAGYCLDTHTTDIRRRVECRLSELTPADDQPPHRLHQSMRYSLLGGGKRIRPIVTVLATSHLGGDETLALDPACAIEMVHTASLILDDLPAMDDARLRRGKPANHRAFGQDTALLAAMGLLNQAYAVIGRAPGLGEGLRLELIELLTTAIGSNGLIAGQSDDLAAQRQTPDVMSLERINRQKTAALFVAGAEAGARIAGITGEHIEAVRAFAHNVGLAFQILDDLLDRTASEHEIGKDTGQDAHRPTVVSFMGGHRAREMAEELLESAVEALAPLAPSSDPLAQLAYCLCKSIPPNAAAAAREG
jgi:geranylgeranyl pyrophosphate synthase